MPSSIPSSSRLELVTVYDAHQRGLAVTVQPKSGRKAWKTIYFAPGGRPRWYHLGSVDAIGLADARKLASRVMFQVAEGKDPAAERRSERGRGTFAELAEKYVERHAKKHNKSWRQGEALVRRYLIPPWGKVPAAGITRADVKAMMGKVDAPILANQVLAAASAIFTWAIKEELGTVNPCKLVQRNATKERERVLSEGEIRQFWTAFDAAGPIGTALKAILLTGQRPGEIANMRREHIIDGWWEMPGDPVPGIWPGTKNGESHRVWLAKPVKERIADKVGFIFGGPRGRPARGFGEAMREIVAKLGVERATLYYLRRTFSTKVTAMGFGRDAMNWVTNHRETAASPASTIGTSTPTRTRG